MPSDPRIKRKKCQSCGKWNATQQDWKKEEEKKYCLTCWLRMQFNKILSNIAENNK